MTIQERIVKEASVTRTVLRDGRLVATDLGVGIERGPGRKHVTFGGLGARVTFK